MKPNYSKIINFIGLVLAILAFIFLTGDSKKEVDVKIDNGLNEVIDFQKYNYQFAEGSVLGTLDKLIGDKRAVFYLPSTGYINITPGDSFGVVFAIQNVIEGGKNYFEYSFEPDDSTLTNCNVTKVQASSWIVTGQKSFGKITGGWIDKMSVYFKFPENVFCKAIYDFKITKDEASYFEDKLTFNIVG